MKRKCSGGPGADVLGGCGHLLVDFHDQEGCHAAARGTRNARFYLPSGYQRDDLTPAQLALLDRTAISRCGCRVTRPWTNPVMAEREDE